MAWVRWSDMDNPHPYVSAIYVMDHTDGDMECVNCQRSELAGTFRCWTREEMAEHVQWHIYSGDPVPDFVIPSLEGDGPRWVDTTLAEMVAACREAGGKIATWDADCPVDLRISLPPEEMVKYLEGIARGDA